MALFNPFSKRQKQLRGDVSDVYVYDVIPNPLRVQIVHILRDAIGERIPYTSMHNEIYESIKNTLTREYGLFALVEGYFDSNEQEVMSFILSEKNYERVLDVVELSFKLINGFIRNKFYDYKQHAEVKMDADAAIAELNARFKENAVGYAFEGNEIIRIDSTYTHAAIVKPTIALLQNAKFTGPNEEYLKAHEHYRHGRNKECLTECLKAFESTMKVICKEKGWTFDAAKDTASKLIAICLANNLVPSYMQTHISGLKSVLDSGINTLRNKTSGHGQGQVPQKVDDEVARYGLNLTGSNIIFLIEQSGIK